MFEINNFGLFVFSTFILNITPGNDFIYVATRSLSQGIRTGIISAFSISAGLIVHVTLSVLGLSVILARSALAFNLIKYLGAAYLIFLGVKMIFSKSSNFSQMADPKEYNAASGKIFWQGFFTNVLNPKVALFFLSFLPQFANPHSEYFSFHLLLLGLWFIFSGTLVSIAIAVFFGKIRRRISSFDVFWKWQKKVTGTILIALGLKIAFEKNI